MKVITKDINRLIEFFDIDTEDLEFVYSEDVTFRFIKALQELQYRVRGFVVSTIFQTGKYSSDRHYCKITIPAAGLFVEKKGAEYRHTIVSALIAFEDAVEELDLVEVKHTMV